MISGNIAKTCKKTILFVGVWVIGFSLFPSPAYAASIGYSISPSSGEIKAGGDVGVTISIRIDEPLAGGSVTVNFENATVTTFEPATTTGLSFIDYHEEQKDVVFICNNNSCPIGNYTIGSFAAKAGENGYVKVTATPKETAKPDLSLIPADATSVTFTIASNAPPVIGNPPASNSSGGTTAKKRTVPQDDGQGGFTSTEITPDEYAAQQNQAGIASAPLSIFNESDEETKEQNATTNLPVLFSIGIGSGVSLGGLLFVVLKFLKRYGGPKGPNFPTDPGSFIKPSL